MKAWRRLGEILVSEGFLSEAVVAAAMERAEPGIRIGEQLVQKGLLSETQLAQALAHQLSLPWVSLTHVDLKREILNHIPSELAIRQQLLPVYVQKARGQPPVLHVAMVEPTDEDALREAGERAQMAVRAMVAARADLLAALRYYYPSAPAAGGGAAKERKTDPPLRRPEVQGADPADAKARPAHASKQQAPPLPARAKMPSITSEMHAAQPAALADAKPRDEK